MTVTGDVLAGRYRLVRLVASGGMGSVWEAWDELLHRPVAIKELLTQPGLNSGDAAVARSRVIREARITARLHHPHAVTLYDVLDHGGQPCLILQYVPSRTLSSILAEQGVLQVRFVAGAGAELASALAAAHAVGIVHRDVKPSNVLITPAGAALITDFGISHAAGDISLTSTGMVSGTPAFLAPEVARGATSSFPSDVFSLGATLYAALEGTPPFGADQNAMAVLHKVASGQIIPPRRSGTLTTLLSHMMAADPAARPAMADVARLLADPGGRRPVALSAPLATTVAVTPRTVREWPADPDEITSAPAPRGSAFAAAPAARGRRHRGVLAIVVTAALIAAAVGTWLLAGGRAQPAAGGSAVSGSSSAPPSPRSEVPTASRRVAPAIPSTTPAPSTPRTIESPAVPAGPAISRTPATGTPAGTAAGPTSRTSAAATSQRPNPTTSRASSSTRAPSTSPSATSPSASPTAPTAAQLAAAITGYYALLPGDTDQGWASLTSTFQRGTAQNRQYYQRFWDSIQRVMVTDPHGASPDTAEATITYYFTDGRTVREITVYSLVAEDGRLKIDSSTVLSSTTG